MKKLVYLFALSLLIPYGCSDDSSNLTRKSDAAAPAGVQMVILNMDLKSGSNAGRVSDGDLMEMITAANVQLKALGMQVSKVEYYGAQAIGNTVFFNDRGNKQLPTDFVPGDPRREGRDYLGVLDGHTDIFYVIDEAQNTTASGLSGAQTTNAITSAMSTWDNVTCSSGLEINNIGPAPFDVGFVQWLTGFGGTPAYTDLMHSGFLPAEFFDLFAEDGGSFILGGTFTFTWTDEYGVPTDIDNNGKDDTAFAETYYNDGIPWGLGTGPTFDISGTMYDVETVALHEMGHGLSQGHFGTAFANKAGLFFSPRALMNAAYSGVQTDIKKTDNSGHCSLWESWPNN